MSSQLLKHSSDLRHGKKKRTSEKTDIKVKSRQLYPEAEKARSTFQEHSVKNIVQESKDLGTYNGLGIFY